MEKELTAFQEMLTEAYKHYCEKHNFRRVSDNQFARYLGVSPASFNQWILGNRTPNYESAVMLAEKLGPEVFDVLGYDRPVGPFSHAPDLRFVAEHWGELDEDTRAEIYRHIQEVIEGRKDGDEKG